MRYYKYILYLILILTSCSESKIDDMYAPSNTPHYMVIENSDLHFSSSSSVGEFSILTTEIWQIYNKSAWVNLPVSFGEGNSNVLLEVSENKSGDNTRVSILEVGSTTENQFQSYIYVSQDKATPYLQLSETEIVVPGKDTTCVFYVDSNVEWICENVSNSGLPDISITKINEKSFSVTLPKNKTKYTNNYTIKVFSKKSSLVRELKIIQIPATIKAETEELLFPQSGAAYKLSIVSDLPWKIKNLTQDWIEMTPTSGNAGTSEISIVALPNWDTNDRQGVINFIFSSSVVLALHIYQEGVKIGTDLSILDFEAYCDSHTFEVISNIDWEVLSLPDWISLSAREGSGNSIITVEASNNSDSLSRTGNIVIGQEGLSPKAIVKVNQDGKFFNHHMSDMTFSSREQSFEIEFNTNDYWNITSLLSSEWLSFTHNEGVGQIYVEGRVSDNPSVNSRSDTIKVQPQDLKNSTLHVAVAQKPRYLEVSHNSVLFFAKGGSSGLIQVETDGTIAVFKENGEWFDLVFSSDSTSFEVIANESEVYSRNGVVKISLSDLKEGTMELSIPIAQYQPGGHFNISDYTDDVIWDLSKNSTVGIKIIGYGDDSNLDIGSSGLTLSIIGYSEDLDWNGKVGGLSLTITGYKEDKRHDKNNNIGNIGIGDYGDDYDWSNDEK